MSATRKTPKRPDPPAFDPQLDAELFAKAVRTAQHDVATQREIVSERRDDLNTAKAELKCRQEKLERLLTEEAPELFVHAAGEAHAREAQSA